MADSLKISLVQTQLFWEDKKANLDSLTSLIKNIDNTDLIVLPEMFTTGFSMNPKLHAENESGESLKWMRDLSKQKNVAICGSLIIEEGGKYYNRLFFVYPTGEYESYSKRHLFTLAGEELVYSQGQEQLIVEFLGWKIMPLICYDLRFPVWSRNVFDYDLLLYVANWPERRNDAWKTLLKARAIENQSFVAGVNRVGLDGNNIEHSGDSMLIGPLGESLSAIEPNTIQVETVELRKKKLNEVRKKLKFLNDRDSFSIDLDG